MPMGGEHTVSTNEQEEHSEPERSRSEGTQTSIGASTSKHWAQLSATQKQNEQKITAGFKCSKKKQCQLKLTEH
jgi:hypothetical protein